jgi:hypothetical protein
MNCGMSVGDQSRLRQIYAEHINHYGLFDNPEVSSRYAIELNQIVTEHAPFYPVSIFAMPHQL